MKIVQKKVSQNSTYTNLEIETLKLDERLVFNIFIKKENDYVIIIEAGTLLSQNLYQKLQKQERLYVKKEDLKKSELSCKNLKYYVKYNKDFFDSNDKPKCNSKFYEELLNNC